MVFEPRGAQIEALCALENARAEGAVKGLVQAATGVGKTYLAAFDSQKYRTVLFVAHREEILKQAAESFRNVRRSDEYGFFDGKSKCTDKPVIFGGGVVVNHTAHPHLLFVGAHPVHRFAEKSVGLELRISLSDGNEPSHHT